MNAKAPATSPPKAPQEVCIDLPGEAVQCWRSSDNIKVVLRKHRDIFFEINLKPGASYTVESEHQFYSPKQKKLLKRITFSDSERFHLWVGRDFKGKLLLRSGKSVIGTYEPNKLDVKGYDANPKTKPEPLMVILGKKELSYPLTCTPQDRFGTTDTQGMFKSFLDPKMSYLKTYGTDFDYQYYQQQPEIKEYACVTEALASEIQPQVVAQLEAGAAVEGTINQIFVPPKPGTLKSDLYSAMGVATGYISGNEYLTANWFKETAGYMQEHWKIMNRILMTVRIEKKKKGVYRVLFKGRLVSRLASQVMGAGTNAKSIKSFPTGSAGSSFIDGGFQKTGKAGYGSLKRLVLTNAQIFRSGVKIQIIGTVIDLIGDVNTVYFDEKGSKDLSEFLGRAGVSIAKAGATAVLGSIFAATGLALAGAGLALVGTAAALPVALVVAVVIGGYIAAATLVDMADSSFNIKETIAGWTK